MNYFSYLFAPTEPLAQCSVLEKLPAVDVFTTSEEIDKGFFSFSFYYHVFINIFAGFYFCESGRN